MNTTALKIIDAVVNRISAYSKFVTSTKPQIGIQNTTALKIIDAVVNRLQSYANQVNTTRPQIQINNSSALNALQALINKIAQIQSKTITITTRTNTIGAAHGMHQTLSSDTLIQAHAGERVDIGQPTSKSVNNMNSGGGGGGQTIIVPISLTIPANEIFPERSIRYYVNKITGSNMNQMT